MNMSFAHKAVESVTSEARSTKRRPVDLVHLARQTCGNRALESEVLELFLMHIPLCLDRLRDAATDQAWREAAHAMVGSARGIGAWVLAETAASAERLTGEARETGRADAISALERHIGDTTGFIRTLLAD